MKKRHFRVFVERARISLLAVVSLAFIAGCSSSISRVQTWEGAAENADQVAVLSAPGAINVREVNGRAMTGFMIDDLSLDYELLPGENRVVFTYKTIWSKAERVDDGESMVHVVETPRQTAIIDAEPGESYRFDIEKPANRGQAEAQARDFSVNLVNSAGQTVATSSPWVASDSQQLASRAPVPAPVPESRRAEASETGASVSTLDRMKSLWGDASEEERREFLRWAFE